MIPDELKKLAEQLRNKERSLVSQLKLIGSENPAVPGDFEPAMPSYGDSGDDTIYESVDLDRNIAVEEALERQLEEVRAALMRIEQGVYGSCMSCGSPIDEKRLRAMPATTSCLNCVATPKKGRNNYAMREKA